MKLSLLQEAATASGITLSQAKLFVNAITKPSDEMWEEGYRASDHILTNEVSPVYRKMLERLLKDGE